MFCVRYFRDIPGNPKKATGEKRLAVVSRTGIFSD